MTTGRINQVSVGSGTAPPCPTHPKGGSGKEERSPPTRAKGAAAETNGTETHGGRVGRVTNQKQTCFVLFGRFESMLSKHTETQHSLWNRAGAAPPLLSSFL
jgi:hypothetical protein